MFEIEVSLLSISVISLLINLVFIQYVRKSDVVLKLILFSFITDAIVSLSTIVTSTQQLLQEIGSSAESHSVFYYSSVPFWIFADILQVFFSFNFSIDRFINFSTPIFYSSVATVYSSWLLFIILLSICFVFSAFLTFEVQKLGDFVGYNGTVCSFFQDGLFKVYFDVLFWICSAAFLLCFMSILLALICGQKKTYWEELQSNSYFLFLNTLICVIRSGGLVASFYVTYWLIADKDLLLPVVRLLSTVTLVILQPGSFYFSLRWYNKHQESKKFKTSDDVEKKQTKNSIAAAIVGPTMMVDFAALSFFASPVLDHNMTTKEMMEQRAERERSVSFYQIVHHNIHNVFMPETPFNDMYSDPFD